MPPTVTIEDDRYAEFEKLAELAGYASADECANHVLRRVKKVIDEYCDEEEDVREMLVQLGYVS